MEEEDHRQQVARQNEKKAKREAKRLQREMGRPATPPAHALSRALSMFQTHPDSDGLPADLAAAADAHLLDGAGRHDEVVMNAKERAGTLHAYGHHAA